MPTKHELLEEKTVKELKQMARDKALSGFSTMKKSELIDLIESNYLKDEIRNWPDLELEEIGKAELGEEKEEQEKSEDTVPVEEVEVDRSFQISRDLVGMLLVLGALGAIAVALIFLYLGS